MRSIGEIPNEADAKRFGDYLYANGIASDVDEDEGTWTVWIHDDEQITKAEQELSAFHKDSDNQRYVTGSKEADKLREEEAKENERAAKRQVDIRTQTWESTGQTPHMTYGLMAACIVVFIALQTGMGDSLSQTLSINTYQTTGQGWEWTPGLPDIQGGEWWRLVTPIIMHLSWLHIIFNMMWINELGKNFEQKHGAFRLLVFVVLAGVFSNLFQYADFPFDEVKGRDILGRGPTFGGMSGVVYALAGYCWMRGRLTPLAGIGLAPETMRFLMIWFAVCFLPFLPIANGAHAGGLAIGLGIGWLAAQRADS